MEPGPATGTTDLNGEVVMSGYDSNTRGRGFPAGTPAVEAVRHVPIHVPEDIKLDVLIDFTDSHIMRF